MLSCAQGSKGWIKNENIKMLGEMAKQTKGSVRVCDSAEEAMSMFVGKGVCIPNKLSNHCHNMRAYMM
jgi:hypothetical protein